MVDVDEIERRLCKMAGEHGSGYDVTEQHVINTCAELRALRACVEAADAMRKYLTDYGYHVCVEAEPGDEDDTHCDNCTCCDVNRAVDVYLAARAKLPREGT